MVKTDLASSTTPVAPAANSSISLLVERMKSISPSCCINAEIKYRLKAVRCDQPMIILPIYGEKRVYQNGRYRSCEPGQFIMIHQPMDLEIENVPSDDHPYRAFAVPFPWRVLNIARLLLSGQANQFDSEKNDLIDISSPSSILNRAIIDHIDLIQQGNLKQADLDLTLLRILVAIHEECGSAFLFNTNPTLSARIRSQVSEAPQQDWTSSYFENEFHVSGATLRRRLMAEGTSLRMLIREARLHVALSKMQTTKTTLKSVVRYCGYPSTTLFKEHFVEFFGIDPSKVMSS